MSYSFGWWDFIDGDEPQMVCRDSDERVVMVNDLSEPWLSKAIAEHPMLSDKCWMRFEYRHEEFCFPLIVNWVPEDGKILVDYNLSSELWCQETNAQTEYPPYGCWMRVDDMVPDAFWCWPNVLEGLFNQRKTFQYKFRKGFFFYGGWLGEKWKKDFISIEAFPLPEASPIEHAGKAKLPYKNNKMEEFYAAYKNETQLKRTALTSVSASLSDAWNFYVGTPEEIQREISNLGASIQLPWSFERSVFGKVVEFVPFLESGFPCLFNSETHQTLQFINIEKGYTHIANFRYWSSSDYCTELSVQMGFHFGELRAFSLFPSSLKWSGTSYLPHDYSHLDCASVDLELNEELQIKREIANAFLKWTGTKEILKKPDSTWDSYDNPLHSYKIFWPIEVTQSAVGLLGGKRCRGRARISCLVENLRDLGNQ